MSRKRPSGITSRVSSSVLSRFLHRSRRSGITYRAFMAANLMMMKNRMHSRSTCISVHEIYHGTVHGVNCAGTRCVFSTSSYNVVSTVRRRSPSVGHNMMHGARRRRKTNSRKVVFNCTYSSATRCVPLPLSLTRVALLRLTHVHGRRPRLVPCLHPSSGSRFAIRCTSSRAPIHVRAVMLSARRSSFRTKFNVKATRGSRTMHRGVRSSIGGVLLPQIVTRLPRGTRGLFGSSVVLRIGPANGFMVKNPRNSANLANHGVVMSACNNENTRNNKTFSKGSPDGMSHSTTCTTECVTGGVITTNMTGPVLVRVSCTVKMTRPIDVFMSACKADGIGLASNRVTRHVKRVFSLEPTGVMRGFKLHGPVCTPATTCYRFNESPCAGGMGLVHNKRRMRHRVRFFK